MPRKKTEDIINERLVPIEKTLAALAELLIKREKNEEAPKPKRKEKRVIEEDEDDDEEEETTSRKALFKNFKNQYKDDGVLLGHDNLLPKKGFVPPARQVYKKVKVTCRVCHKRKLVDPGEAPKKGSDISYACDSCSASRR